MSTKRVIFLNGPPRSGKDTAAKIVAELTEPRRPAIVKFAMALKLAMHRLYGLDLPHDYFEVTKDQPRHEFYGLKPRDVYIGGAEDYWKKHHGDRIFGTLLLEQLRAEDQLADDNGTRPPLYLVSDSGFRSEAEVLVEAYGPEACLLFRLHRPGATFEGDSRSYVDLADLGVDCEDLPSCQNVGELRLVLQAQVLKWELNK